MLQKKKKNPKTSTEVSGAVATVIMIKFSGTVLLKTGEGEETLTQNTASSICHTLLRMLLALSRESPLNLVMILG